MKRAKNTSGPAMDLIQHGNSQVQLFLDRGMQNEPYKEHKKAACSYVSQGAVPKTSAKAFTSHPSEPENAEPFDNSDDHKNLDFTSTNKTVNEFDFPLLDFDQSMFTSEDHTKILMQADNILQSANHQLLDMQLGMTFEEKLFKVESQSSTLPFSSDGNTQQRRDVISAAIQGNELDLKTHLASSSLSSSKQNEPKLTDSVECRKKKNIPIQDNMKKKPTSFTRQSCIFTKRPSNSDIQKEIRKSQDSLQGALSTAKAISAILKVRTGRDGKEMQFRNSELEFETFKNIKSQAGHDTQIQNDNDVGLHLASQIRSIPEPGGVSQSMTKDQIVLTDQADMPDVSLNYKQRSTRSSVPSNVCVRTKLMHESQTQNDHSQPCSCDCEHCLEYVASQVKRRQMKLRSEDPAAFKNTDTKVLKSTLKNDSCAKEKMHIGPCNSAVIHSKASFPSEENVGNTDPQPERRLVVQALPSLTIKRDLSVQKVPSVSIPSPGAPPYVPLQQNVGLCEMSHSQVQLGQRACMSKTCNDNRSTDKRVLKAKPKLHDGYRQYILHEHTAGTTLKDETRKHSDQEQRSSRGSCASSVSGKRSRVTDASLRKLLSPEKYHIWCRRCKNNSPLTDLYYGVCGKCRNIPSSSHEVKQYVCDSTPDVVKAAACLDRCMTCLRHFPKSELFHGHCIQCQIVKNKMRLFQCNICLNSVPSTEYVNGKCNRCHYRFKSDTQKDELDTHPVLQGPKMDRILNTVLDETPFFFNINEAQCIDKSPSTRESTSIQKNKESDPLFRANKKGAKSYMVQEETMKTQYFIANDRTRKNSVNNCKAHFATEEYLKGNDINKENKSIKTHLDESKQNNKQEVMFQNFESDDEREFHGTIRAASVCQKTPYTGPPETGHLSSSLGIHNYDEEDISSGSNGSSWMEVQATYDKSRNYDGGIANSDIDGYEQDFKSESKSSDIELKVSEDNGGYSRMYPSAPSNVKYGTEEQETQAHVHKIAEIQISVHDFPKRNPKRVSKNLGTVLPIMDNAQNHLLDMSNRDNSDPDKMSQLDNKILEPSDETDASSNRIYNDKSDDTSESVSDTNMKAKDGSRNKSLVHGNISKTLPNRNRQPYKYCHNDHIESSQAAEKPKYSSSKSIAHATTSRNVDCSHKHSFHNRQNRTKLNNSDPAINNRRYNVSKCHQQCFDDNYNGRKPVQTLKIASVKEHLQSPRTPAVTKKSAACRNKPKDYNAGKKQLKLTTTVEGELVTGTLGQAGEENYKDIRSVPAESSSTDTKDGQILLADDNRSVNEDDVYEDDWEEELEDSEEKSRGRDDKEEEPSENISHVSGRDTEGTSRADSEAALSLDSSEHPQKHPCHSPSARVINPYTTVPCEKTSPCRPVAVTPPVCPGKVSSKKYFQKPVCVDHETSPVNIPFLKCEDKGSSPISIPGEVPVSRETSSISISSVEHVHKGLSSVSIPDKKCINRQTSPISIPSELPTDKASSPIKIPSMEHIDKGLLSTGIQTEKPADRETYIRISSGSPVDKSTSPVSFPPQKLTLPPCKYNCNDVCTHGAQVDNSLRGLPLCDAKSAGRTPNLQSIRQQTALPEQTETHDGTSQTHSEVPQSSHTKVEPLDTAYDTKGIDIETQTDVIMEDTGHHNKMEKIKKKKCRGLACVQSRQDDELSSSSSSQQDIVSVQHEIVPRSSSPSSPHAYTTETTCTTASVSNGQVSPSDGELLVSCSSCSVGELFVSGVPEGHCSSSCHTNSHSVGEVWKCHWFETHCLCSEEEVAVDGTLHRGQHVSWIQHASRTQIVNGIIVHSSASVEDDFDSSEGTNNSMPSFSVAQVDAEVQHTRINLGPYDHSCVGCNSRSEGELSEGQVMTWHR